MTISCHVSCRWSVLASTEWQRKEMPQRWEKIPERYLLIRQMHQSRYYWVMKIDYHIDAVFFFAAIFLLLYISPSPAVHFRSGFSIVAMLCLPDNGENPKTLEQRTFLLVYFLMYGINCSHKESLVVVFRNWNFHATTQSSGEQYETVSCNTPVVGCVHSAPPVGHFFAGKELRLWCDKFFKSLLK